MWRPLWICGVLLVTACGLAENPRDEQNKYEYITFVDPAFREYCLRHFDSSNDGRISRYEAQRVLTIDCPGLGIEAMWEISAFANIQTLICNSNRITELDLSRCTALQRVDCSSNELLILRLNNLRSLTQLNCSTNRLTDLNLQSCASLQTLQCADNELRTLDVVACSRSMREVNALRCPLTVFYKAVGQQIRVLQLDDMGVVVEQ